MARIAGPWWASTGCHPDHIRRHRFSRQIFPMIVAEIVRNYLGSFAIIDNVRDLLENGWALFLGFRYRPFLAGMSLWGQRSAGKAPRLAAFDSNCNS